MAVRKVTDWEALLWRLPADARERFERQLRRVLTRRLARVARQDVTTVPDSVRSQAVGEYRKQHAAKMSKAGLRRMNYQRLHDDPHYQEIERRLAEAYWRRHGLAVAGAVPDVEAMSFIQACEAFRASAPKVGSTGLEEAARDACRAAYPQAVDAGAVRDALAAKVLRAARESDLTTCATVHATGPSALAGVVHRGFHLYDVTTEAEVAERVRLSQLVEGVLQSAFDGRRGGSEVRRELVEQLRAHPAVTAMESLIEALTGADAPLQPQLERLVQADAREVTSWLHGAEFAAAVAHALLENPVHGPQYRRSVELRLRVRERVPETPMEAYPLARSMRRHFVLHVGPTNSGKTHDALQALMRARTGAYLGPLRLLAYEQYEWLNREGCACSLVTGEERTDVAGARHVSSTVEMADFGTPIELAVIDEAQMVADPDRGHAWTAAILGIPAAVVHVCCAPHAQHVVERLVSLCDDECEVVRHERLVPLRPDRGSFSLPEDVQPGDALVVFSRKAVHLVAGEVAAAGLRPSVIYGALPYAVRHEEARRFAEGETNVVVATDAIGMGMNLPIRCVVFVEQKKFDGHELRFLRAEEVQQIAGRAGRYGRYSEGLFQSARQRKEVTRLWRAAVPDIRTIPVGIPADLSLVAGMSLSEAIAQWAALEQPSPFERIDIARDLLLVGEVEAHVDEERRKDPAFKETALALAGMPFDEGEARLWKAWVTMAKAELAGTEAALPLPGRPAVGDKLVDLEANYRYCDLLYTYARTFGYQEWLAPLTERREEISRAIMHILAA